VGEGLEAAVPIKKYGMFRYERRNATVKTERK
jgi:hypothetical protein